MPTIPLELKKCVTFLGYYNHKEAAPKTTGSAFIVGTKATDDPLLARGACLVTARHNISQLQSQGVKEIWVRFNFSDGSEWRKTLAEDWIMGADGLPDVAAYPADLPSEIQHVALPISMIPKAIEAWPFPVAESDEVWVLGLFHPHAGQSKLLPIVRRGSVSFLADRAEPVSTPVGPMFAHLIEVRSIGGLSGSPVFSHVSLMDSLTGKVSPKGPHLFLLGLISGHFGSSEVESLVDSQGQHIPIKTINSGIAYVTPAEEIHSAFLALESDAQNRLFFLPDSDLSEGSIWHAMRRLSKKDANRVVEMAKNSVKLILNAASGHATIEELQESSAAVEMLRTAGWDGKSF